MVGGRVTKIEELEAKLEANRLARANAESDQYEKDLEARIALEETHGTVAAVKVARFTPGHPTRAYLRTPTSAEYKRYKSLLYRAQADKKSAVMTAQCAQDQIAKACWVYPAPDPTTKDGISAEQVAMLEAFPGLLTQLFIAATALAEGKTEDTGKD